MRRPAHWEIVIIALESRHGVQQCGVKTSIASIPPQRQLTPIPRKEDRIVCRRAGTGAVNHVLRTNRAFLHGITEIHDLANWALALPCPTCGHEPDLTELTSWLRGPQLHQYATACAVTTTPTARREYCHDPLLLSRALLPHRTSPQFKLGVLSARDAASGLKVDLEESPVGTRYVQSKTCRPWGGARRAARRAARPISAQRGVCRVLGVPATQLVDVLCGCPHLQSAGGRLFAATRGNNQVESPIGPYRHRRIALQSAHRVPRDRERYLGTDRTIRQHRPSLVVMPHQWDAGWSVGTQHGGIGIERAAKG